MNDKTAHWITTWAGMVCVTAIVCCWLLMPYRYQPSSPGVSFDKRSGIFGRYAVYVDPEIIAENSAREAAERKARDDARAKRTPYKPSPPPGTNSKATIFDDNEFWDEVSVPVEKRKTMFERPELWEQK